MPRDEAWVLDMMLAAGKVQQFTAGVTRERFDSDEVLQNAVMRQIQIIGEAARSVSDEYRQAHPTVPWQGITAMRHRLVHEYFQIDLQRVWDVVETDIAELIRLLTPLVPAGPS